MAPSHSDLIAAQARADEAQARVEVMALAIVAGYVRSITPDAAFLRLDPGRGGRLVMGDGLDERMRRLPRDDEPGTPGLADAMSALAYVDEDGWWVDELTRPTSDDFALLLDLAAVVTARR